jgi:hypothetical protein
VLVKHIQLHKERSTAIHTQSIRDKRNILESPVKYVSHQQWCLLEQRQRITKKYQITDFVPGKNKVRNLYRFHERVQSHFFVQQATLSENCLFQHPPAPAWRDSH